VSSLGGVGTAPAMVELVGKLLAPGRSS